MKILYATQATGNGHLSRARDIIPLLQKKGKVDILTSGIHADIPLPYPVRYKFNGLGFMFGRNGGVDMLNTFRRNSLSKIVRELRTLPIDQYDLIINDFEPISAWSSLLKGKPSVALSHQCAVLSKKAPLPKEKSRMGKFILQHYAPATVQYGFHFSRFDENIFTPVIRKEIRQLTVSDKGHYTVYLPSYDDNKLIETFSSFRDIQWQIFSKHNKKAFTEKNISIRPIANKAFMESMAACRGIICGAGFETPAEAMFLGKKLMVIPMKNQYEQACNAAALDVLGVPVVKDLKAKQHPQIESWLQHGLSFRVDFPDITEEIIDMVVEKHAPTGSIAPSPLWGENSAFLRF